MPLVDVPNIVHYYDRTASGIASVELLAILEALTSGNEFLGLVKSPSTVMFA